MNNTVFCDLNFSDDIRCQQLYDGQLFVDAARPKFFDFGNFARSMIEDAFGGLDPGTAQTGPLASRFRPTAPSSLSTYRIRSRGRAGYLSWVQYPSERLAHILR
jgi:hypothetical protein